AHTGLRLGELCGWHLEGLHLAERRAAVARSLGGECSMLDPQPSTTKTGRERAVDLSSEVVTILGAIKARRGARAMARGWRPMPPWVFVTRNGTPYSQRYVNRDFKRMLVKGWTARPLLAALLAPHLRHAAPAERGEAAMGTAAAWARQHQAHDRHVRFVDTRAEPGGGRPPRRACQRRCQRNVKRSEFFCVVTGF